MSFGLNEKMTVVAKNPRWRLVIECTLPQHCPPVRPFGGMFLKDKRCSDRQSFAPLLWYKGKQARDAGRKRFGGMRCNLTFYLKRDERLATFTSKQHSRFKFATGQGSRFVGKGRGATEECEQRGSLHSAMCCANGCGGIGGVRFAHPDFRRENLPPY
jgi:hypothetical protein